MSDAREQFPVAVVVHTLASGVDQGDAINGAEKAVKRALGSAGTWNSSAPLLTIHAQTWDRKELVPVHVTAIESIDRAFRRGSLTVHIALGDTTP